MHRPLAFEFRTFLRYRQNFLNRTNKKHPTSLLRRCGLCELIENVEVSLILYLSHDPAFFQQIVRNLSTDRLSVVVEHDFKIFALGKSKFMNVDRVTASLT